MLDRKMSGGSLPIFVLLPSFWAWKITDVVLGTSHKFCNHGFNPQNSLHSISWVNWCQSEEMYINMGSVLPFWDTYIYDSHSLRWKVAVLEYVICPQPRTVSGIFPNAIRSTSQNIKSLNEKSAKFQASLLTPPGWVVLVSAPPKATALLQSYRSVHAPATPICQSP